VYVIAEGECTVIVDGQLVPEPYGTMGPGEIFGDMAVLYDEVRSATVIAKNTTDTVTLYRVDWDTFKDILSKSDEATDTKAMQEIDEVINQVAGSSTLYKGNIIPPYKPERAWLWTRWTGTILKVSYQATLLNMLVSLVFAKYASFIIAGDGSSTDWWNPLETPHAFTLALSASLPDQSHPLIQQLNLVHGIWSYLQALATFILTFYLQEAYSFWKAVYNAGRAIQGRLNDHQLTVATNVAREKDGSMTPESEQLMDDIGQFSSLFHVLMWASTADRFQVLQTLQGLRRMATRGLVTPRQLQVLQNLTTKNNLPEYKLYYSCLQWMMIRVNVAMDKGHLRNDDATKRQLIQYMASLRGSHGDIQDKLDCRTPLAYSHLVQLLVDTFVWMAPFALYSDLGDYSIFAVGILTLFYTGLLNLAKIFLDPLNNEEFCENSIVSKQKCQVVCRLRFISWTGCI